MTLDYIFSSKYLFNPIPPKETALLWYFFGFFVALIVIAAATYFIKAWDIKIRLRQFYCFLTIGILGLVYQGARYEQLPWLGSRLFLALILLILVIWILINTVWLAKYNGKLAKKRLLEERYEKYLPKNKK